MNIWRDNVFLIFFDKQTKQCLVISSKLIHLLIVIDLIVRVFIFCKYALFVFLSETHVPFCSTPFYFIIFCSFLWNIYRKYLSAKYVSKLMWICTAYTVLKLEYETYGHCYFFTFFIFPLKFFIWRSLLKFYSVSAKFGACYMTGQWIEFRIK